MIMKTSAAERRKRERERRGGTDTQVVKRQDRGGAIRRTRNKGNSERRLGGGRWVFGGSTGEGEE